MTLLLSQQWKKWATKFRRGKQRLEDNTNSGRPAIVTAKENIDRVHHSMNGLQAENYKSNIQYNLYIPGEIWEYSAQWTKDVEDFCSVVETSSHTWSKEQRTDHITEKKLTLFESDQAVFLLHFLSPDASWVHHRAFRPTTYHLLDITFVFWVWMLFSNISCVWSSEHCWPHRYALFNRILWILFFVNYFFCEDQLQICDGK